MVRGWHCSISARALWHLQPSAPKYSDSYHVTNSSADTDWQTNLATDTGFDKLSENVFLVKLRN